MPRKPKQQIQDEYALSYRIRLRNGNWDKWVIGTGQWIGIEHVQSQVMMLKRSRKDRDMEFKIFRDGKYLNLKEQEIEGSFTLDIRK